MQEWIDKIQPIFEVISQMVTLLTIMATIIVRFVKKDKAVVVGSFAEKLLKVLGWLPTIGLNPKTKELEKKLKELNKS